MKKISKVNKLLFFVFAAYFSFAVITNFYFKAVRLNANIGARYIAVAVRILQVVAK